MERLLGHMRAHRNEKPYVCGHEGCGKAFARSHDCKRHEKLHLKAGAAVNHTCKGCDKSFARLDALQRHRQYSNSLHSIIVLNVSQIERSELCVKNSEIE